MRQESGLARRQPAFQRHGGRDDAVWIRQTAEKETSLNESTEGYGWRLVITAALEEFFEKAGRKPRRRWLRKRRQADVAVRDEGSLWIVWLLTEWAEDWADENLPTDCLDWAGGIAIEAHVMPEILRSAEADGLTIAGH